MSKYSDIRAERILKNVVKPPRKKEFEFTLEGSIEDILNVAIQILYCFHSDSIFEKLDYINKNNVREDVVAHYSAEDFYSKMMPASGVYEKENVK
jgi:hypothetical protein